MSFTFFSFVALAVSRDASGSARWTALCPDGTRPQAPMLVSPELWTAWTEYIAAVLELIEVGGSHEKILDSLSMFRRQRQPRLDRGRPRPSAGDGRKRRTVSRRPVARPPSDDDHRLRGRRALQLSLHPARPQGYPLPHHDACAAQAGARLSRERLEPPGHVQSPRDHVPGSRPFRDLETRDPGFRCLLLHRLR